MSASSPSSPPPPPPTLSSLHNTVTALGHKNHLDRERALTHLRTLLPRILPCTPRGGGNDDDDNPVLFQQVVDAIRPLLDAPEWEARAGGFLAARDVLNATVNVGIAEVKVKTDAASQSSEPAWNNTIATTTPTPTTTDQGQDVDGTRPSSGTDHDVSIPQRVTAFLIHVRARAVAHITDPEVRVRQAVGEALGAAAAHQPFHTWKQAAPVLLQHIVASFDLDQAQRAKEAAKQVEASGNYSKGTELVHDTEGWRSLETCLISLYHCLCSCGVWVYDDDSTRQTLQFTLRARSHPNRFVRETSLKVLTVLVISASEADKRDRGSAQSVEHRPSQVITIAMDAANGTTRLETLAFHIVDSVAEGLEDNWSQVRYVSSICVRELIRRCPPQVREQLYPTLIPRMCLNRHYVAEGVRVYSQDTWKSVMGTQGRVWLIKCMPQVVAYYELQTKADNHAVREAACQSIAEIASKLDSHVVQVHVPRMLVALADAFKDESWPVRDHACTACAIITEKFPQVIQESGLLQEIFDLWLAHLADNIPSVRSNSASALAKAAAAFPHNHPICGLDLILVHCKQLLPTYEKQPRDSTRYGSLSGASQFGASHKLARDNDPHLHTNQTMYSCGSLAPKLRRGGGCMDHGFSRSKEPWEQSDGALRLWGQLVQLYPQQAATLLPDVVSILNMQGNFAHAPYLLETAWMELAMAAQFIHKDLLQDIIPDIISSLDKTKTCGHKLAEAAAKTAEINLRKALGADLLKKARQSTI